MSSTFSKWLKKKALEKTDIIGGTMDWVENLIWSVGDRTMMHMWLMMWREDSLANKIAS